MNEKADLIALAAIIFQIANAQEKPAPAGSNAQEIADKLSNPVANLISVPLQSTSTMELARITEPNTLNIQP